MRVLQRRSVVTQRNDANEIRDPLQPEPEARGTKPYEPPQVTRVSLRPEEAVLGACKTMTIPGPGAPACTFSAPCPNPGS
jgi:hypothetical protein